MNVSGRNPVKVFENPFLIFPANANSVITHRYETTQMIGMSCNGDNGFCFGIFHRIIQKIVNNVRQVNLIGQNDEFFSLELRANKSPPVLYLWITTLYYLQNKLMQIQFREL